MIRLDPRTGRRIGSIGDFELNYASFCKPGEWIYKLVLHLSPLDESLRLKELPSIDVGERNITAAQQRHPVFRLFHEIFDVKLRWVGRYDWTYIIELPETATDAQIDEYIRRLQEEADRNQPSAVPEPVSAKPWWKRLFRFA